MKVKCTATIDNPDKMSKFAKKVENLGLKPQVNGNMISVEYIGYNQTRYNLLIDLFEDEIRHSIDTHKS